MTTKAYEIGQFGISLVVTDAGEITALSINTNQVTEGTNKYYTDARARAAVSATGSLTYNSATGVIGFTQGNSDTVSEGSTNLYHTTARVRSALSGSTIIAYNSTTGAIDVNDASIGVSKFDATVANTFSTKGTSIAMAIALG